MAESSSRDWGRRSQVRFLKPNSCHNNATCVKKIIMHHVSGIIWTMEQPIPYGQCEATHRSDKTERKYFRCKKTKKQTKNKTRVSPSIAWSCLQQVFHGWKENKRAGCIPLKVQIISGLKSNWCSCLWILRKLFQSDFHNQLTVLPSGPPHLSDPSMVAYRQGYLGNQRELHAHILITRNWVVS